jgi:transposase
MSLELGESKWLLGFSDGPAQKARKRSIAARDRSALNSEIARAKQRFGLRADAPVRSCYEAGRDGFWLHRYLLSIGIQNVVIDSSSIEVKRRKRHAKSDGLDVQGLLNLLMRYHGGERKAFSVVRVPSVEMEDARQLHREIKTLKEDRVALRNRIKGLLATQGVALKIWPVSSSNFGSLKLYDRSKLGDGLRGRLERDFERLQHIEKDIRELQTQQRRQVQQLASSTSEPLVRAAKMIERLKQLRGINTSASTLVFEAFGWREFNNRRQVGSCFGLVPTPYQSANSDHEQGISKAGNIWVRAIAVELAWLWLRLQPESELSRWYFKRWGQASSRQRRVGIVALARKLMIALWRYAERSEIPQGAKLKVSGSEQLQAAA